MQPCSTSNNAVNCPSGNAKLFGDVTYARLRREELSDQPHIALGELCSIYLIALWLPPFVDLVLRVLGNCAKEQMARINTRRVIALVEHLQPYRYFTKVQMIGQSVSAPSFATDPLRQSIAIAIDRPMPLPAFIYRTWCNMRPKGFLWRFINAKADAMPVDVLFGFACDPTFILIAPRSKIGHLPTAAMAVAIGNFVKGKLGLGEFWGMLRHSIVSFQTLLTPRDARKASPWQLVSCSNYSMKWLV